MLPIPTIPDHPTDLMEAYKHRLVSSPITSSNQPLLTFMTNSGTVTVTVKMLAQALHVMLQELGMDSSLYSFHSLKRD